MIILVADTSILIELERGDLLEIALSGPDTLATPDLARVNYSCRQF